MTWGQRLSNHWLQNHFLPILLNIWGLDHVSNTQISDCVLKIIWSLSYAYFIIVFTILVNSYIHLLSFNRFQMCTPFMSNKLFRFLLLKSSPWRNPNTEKWEVNAKKKAHTTLQLLQQSEVYESYSASSFCVSLRYKTALRGRVTGQTRPQQDR